jgi:uncharacterized protein (TIGR00369 family)
MPLPTPQDPNFAARCRESFNRQGAMQLIHASMIEIAAGYCVVEMPITPSVSQQHGFVHAGILTTALDTACGFASATLMPADSGILTIEFKVNLLAPAAGDRLRLIGKVRKAGRTITLAEGDAFALTTVAGVTKEKLVATMTATNMTILGRPAVKG